MDGESTRLMQPGISWAEWPLLERTAWKAIGQGWFLTSAVTSPFTSLPRMMVRPLKAANPATTSAMLARSQVTVMRGSSARLRADARVSVTPTSGRLAAGAAAVSSTSSWWATLEVQAWNLAVGPKATRTASPARWTWYVVGPSRSSTIRTTSGRNWE